MLLGERSHLRHLIERWISFSVRHPWICAVGWIALTLVAMWGASGLKLKTNLAALLPETYPSVRELDRVRQKVGGLERQVFVIESPDSAANRKFAIDLGTRLQERDDMQFVEWSTDMSFFDDHQLLYMDYGDLVTVYRRVSARAQMSIFSEPLDFSDIEEKYRSDDDDELDKRNGWTTPDGTIRLLMTYPVGQSGNMGASREILARGREDARAMKPTSYHPEMQVFVGGAYRNRVDEYESILSDIKSTGLFALCGIVILISLYFRQYFAWLFIGYPLVAGLSWTFFITWIAIGNLNLITGFLIAVLAGLGIDFGIHVFSRYIEERGNGRGLEEAVRLAVINTGAAIATSATTTMAAFYSLTITDFKGFSEFGFIAGTGIAMTLGAILLTFPAFIVIGEKFGVVRHRRHVREWKRDDARLPFSRPALVTFIVLLSVGAVVVTGVLPDWRRSRDQIDRGSSVDSTSFMERLTTGIAFEYNFSRLRANLPDTWEVKNKIYSIREWGSSPAAIVVEDPVARAEVVDSLKAMKARAGESSAIENVRTIEGFLPEMQDRKMRLIRRLQRVVNGHEEEILEGQSKINIEDLKRWVNVGPVTTDRLPDFITRKFYGPDGSLGEFVVVGTNASLSNGLEAIRFADEVREVTTSTKTHYSSGSAIILADMLIVMRRDSALAVTATFITVFIILLVDFRGLRPTLIVMSPLLAAILLMLGIMTLASIKLNFFNMVVLPSIIGIGIDNGVHLYHRYKEEGLGSLRYVMMTTGGAVMMASITTAIGFSGMRFATHEGLNSMGSVALIGMFTVLAASLVYMPALLTWMEDRWGHPGDGQEPAEQ